MSLGLLIPISVTACPMALPFPWTVLSSSQEGRREFPEAIAGAPCCQPWPLPGQVLWPHPLSVDTDSCHAECVSPDLKSPLLYRRHGLPYTRLVPQFLEVFKQYILADSSLSVGFASLSQSNSIYYYSCEWSQEPLSGVLEEYKLWDFFSSRIYLFIIC